MAAPASEITLPQRHVVPEWHTQGCSSFDKRTGGKQKNRLGALSAVLTSTERLWDNGREITCTFVSPKGTTIQQEKVKKVVLEWAKYANIKFKFVTTRNATIRIAFDEDEGSWSYVGDDNEQIPRTQQTMNYGWVSTAKAITEEDRGVILHEFGHCLGYLHEHQSSRRTDKLTLDEPAVLEFYMRTQGWTEQDVRQQILDVYDDSEVSSFSSVDLTSIMMYFMPKEMNLERIEIPPNNALSNTDKAYAVINYPYLTRPQGTLADPKWTVDFALETAGVQGEPRAKILSAFQQGNVQGMRTEFALWSLNQRAAFLANKRNLAKGVENAATPPPKPVSKDAV